MWLLKTHVSDVAAHLSSFQERRHMEDHLVWVLENKPEQLVGCTPRAAEYAKERLEAQKKEPFEVFWKALTSRAQDHGIAVEYSYSLT